MSRSTFAPGFSLPLPARARRSSSGRPAAPAATGAPASVPYAWLPAHIRRGLSPRARRLMRADY
ncbi:MAG: hypothetical protein EOO25_08985 [Comamonadaceae bacterium]|nr:MAG: hypothetical protein EOO25_08985 [Comamonadaceae bacterium]